MGKIKLSMIVVLLGSMQGCATLSESECEHADWRLIGLEDGSAGKPVSQIGRHRKACAEYGIKPDVARYESGHADGVRRFCLPRNGFELGKAGRGHHDVCPDDLREGFNIAYLDGREVHAVMRAMQDAQNRVKTAYSDLDGISESIAALEGQLVAGTGSPLDRKNWIEQLKLLEAEREQLLVDIHSFEHEADDLQHEYQVTVAKFNY